MGQIRARLEPKGPIIEISVMATPQRVAVLKANGMRFPTPVTIKALIDTGASGSAIDTHVLGGMNLTPTGSVPVHTPSTGPTYDEKNQFDVCVAIVDRKLGPVTFTVGVIEAELASEGFLALIGWDILKHCVLTCNGPTGMFSLKY